MKYLALILFALSAWGQTFVTVTGPIPSANGTGWTGTIFYSWPGMTCGSTFIGPDRKSVKVADGIIQAPITLLAGCPTPYMIRYEGSTTATAAWTIPLGTASTATIGSIQSNFLPNPFYQFSPYVMSLPAGGSGKCWGANDSGTAWQWNTCAGGSSGGGGTWGSIIGTLASQADLKTALDAKAAVSHAHAIADVATLQAELNAKEPAVSAGDSGFWKFDKTWGMPSKLDVGLPNVDNTSDLGKPVSAAMQTALNSKVGTAGPGFYIAGTTGSVDPLVIPRFAISSGTPSGTFAAGSLFATDTTNSRPFWPIAANTFVRIAKYSEIPGVMVGDSGSGGAAGLVPAPAAGDAVAVKYLEANGTWSVPAGSGGGGSTTGLYSATVTFSSPIAPGAWATQTFTATGLAAGRPLSPGWPSGLPAGVVPRVVASAADTVTVHLYNASDSDVTPGALVYSVRDLGALGYLSGSATIDWASLAPGQCSTNTITVTGAAAGDNVAPGWPVAIADGLTPSMRVTSANTITAQICSQRDADYDPPSGTFTAAVSK